MILHLFMDEKFTSDFLDLVENEFNSNKDHIFLIITRHKKLRYEIKSKAQKIFIRQDILSLFRLICYIIEADKIIIHGLFNPYLVCLLFFLHAGRKSIWVIWGGDLYGYKNENYFLSFIKRRLVQTFYGVISQFWGDVELARRVYGFKGKWYEGSIYPSNIASNDNVFSTSHDKYTILIGNSADMENRHLYILEKIKGLNFKNVRFILPLSYGPQAYANDVEKAYKLEYGNNVLCLKNFMPKNEYIKLLSEVDVVLFAHNRQQAVGNLIQLINIGAKVYMESHVTPYIWLKENGINVFDFETIDDKVLLPLSVDEKENNKKIIRKIASKEKTIKNLESIFIS